MTGGSGRIFMVGAILTAIFIAIEIIKIHALKYSIKRKGDDNMTKENVIEDLRGRGMTAKVTIRGKLFPTYDNFAKEAGYPDAVRNERETYLYNRKDETFKVLARGNHESPSYSDVTIYVIESEDGERFLVGDDGLEITEPSTKTPAELTSYEISELSLTEQMAELDGAVKYVDKLHGAIRRKMYAEGFEEGRKAGREEAEEKRFNDEFDSIRYATRGTEWKDNVNPPSIDELMALGKEMGKTEQHRRDEIVEQAKADIEDLKFRMISDTINDEGSSIFRRRTTVVDFVVNKEKRTIVAIIEGAHYFEIFAKGIAKCSPEDCFNVHIGKAIALRRALGLGVPVEYINTPQPTEVRVGDVVKVCVDDGSIEIKPVIGVYPGDRWDVSIPGRVIKCPSAYAKIFDDSREEE